MKKSITVDEYCKQPKGSFKQFVMDNPDADKLALDAKKYPYIIQFGIKIYDDPLPHIKWADLRKALKTHKINQKLFSDYFGAQTCCSGGPYVHDVEAVFVRIFEERLTGTQFFWD